MSRTLSERVEFSIHNTTSIPLDASVDQITVKSLSSCLCDACLGPIAAGEPRYEVKFAGLPSQLSMHAGCYVVWNATRLGHAGAL